MVIGRGSLPECLYSTGFTFMIPESLLFLLHTYSKDYSDLANQNLVFLLMLRFEQSLLQKNNNKKHRAHLRVNGNGESTWDIRLLSGQITFFLANNVHTSPESMARTLRDDDVGHTPQYIVDCGHMSSYQIVQYRGNLTWAGHDATTRARCRVTTSGGQ